MINEYVFRKREQIQNYISANKITKELFYKNSWLYVQLLELYEEIKENFVITFKEFYKFEEEQYNFYKEGD